MLNLVPSRSQKKFIIAEYSIESLSLWPSLYMELRGLELEDDAVWACETPEKLLRLPAQRNAFSCVNGHPPEFDLAPKQQLQELGVILVSGEITDLQFLQQIQGDTITCPAFLRHTFIGTVTGQYSLQRTHKHTQIRG